MSRFTRNLTLGVVLALPMSYPAAAKAPATVDYTVHKGDTLFELAENYFERRDALRLVQQMNGVADPRRLVVGSRLRIPRSVLREERTFARVETFSGPVNVQAAGQALAARVGGAVGEGGVIETGRDAFVTLRLSDGTAVSITSQSRVKIDRLRKIALTGTVERNFSVAYGRLRSRVVPMTDPRSTFRVTTPITVSAVRGTEFRISYDPQAERAGTEVDEGKVAVAAPTGKNQLLVQPGFGRAASAAGLTDAIVLLDAPMLVNPGMVQSGQELAFTLAPVASAQGYRIQVARDAGLLDVLAEASTAAPAINLPSLPAGSYFVRISALDQFGLEGMSRTYTFERSRNSVLASLSQSGAGRNRKYLFQFAGEADGPQQFRFQLSRLGEQNLPMVDEVGLAGSGITVTNLPPGDYSWRVMSTVLVNGKSHAIWTSPQEFHIAK